MKANEILVNQIIDKLEQWFIPWKQPWVNTIACNYVSNKPYRGFNKLVLSFNEFEDNRYLTIKQIKKLWWWVKKWSKWTKIYFFKYNKESNEDNEKEVLYSFPIIRYYNVFNIEQTYWINRQTNIVTDTRTSLFKAQNIITNYKDKPVIKNWSNASYNLIDDVITIPSLNKFKSNEEYFSTLFHELIHSTWNKKRLARFWVNNFEYFWSENYSKEELIAELWSMFLCMEAWIINHTENNSKNYIAWWLNYIKWNKNHLILASNFADRATDYILWYQYN